MEGAVCRLLPQTDELPCPRLAPYFDLRPDVMLQNQSLGIIPDHSMLGINEIGLREAEIGGF